MTSPRQSTNSAVLHRRPAYAVNSPALLCHQCYRFADIAQSGSSELSQVRRDTATIKLNQILFLIQTKGMAEKSDLPIYVVNARTLSHAPVNQDEKKLLAAEQEFAAL